ncbi:hypothetical protein M0802_009885 [Mischocyttarus mexicanus]|nr:hypothetical protein M0802_009885 [Mischocyttarus mexicanus]
MSERGYDGGPEEDNVYRLTDSFENKHTPGTYVNWKSRKVAYPRCNNARGICLEPLFVGSCFETIRRRRRRRMKGSKRKKERVARRVVKPRNGSQRTSQPSARSAGLLSGELNAFIALRPCNSPVYSS